MKDIKLPKDCNYIAAFLTFRCSFNCSYCINHHGGDLQKRRELSGSDWATGLARIKTTPDLPVTLQGGEPTMHKDFYEIVGRLETTMPMDLLTNLNVNVKEFMHHVNPKAFDRDAKYASIRVSYHHGQHSFNKLLEKVMLFKKHNYNIGIWEVEHPEYRQDVLKRQSIAQTLGVDYRIKEFLGPYKGDNYGSMHYGMAVNDKHLRSCLCRTNELLIGPSGDIYRCHADLYSGFNPIGNIMDARIPELGKWRECRHYGRCNSCDIKVKTNRFQEFGYSSVEITNVGPAYKENKVLDDVVNTYRKEV